MPKKKKSGPLEVNRQLPEVEIVLAERRSPIPYNSFEAGCKVRMPVTTDPEESLDQIIEIAEEGLDRARALLEARLIQDQKDGVV